MQQESHEAGLESAFVYLEVAMWAMIIITSMSLNATAITTLPGFTSKGNCEEAAKHARDAMVNLRTICVPVK